MPAARRAAAPPAPVAAGAMGHESTEWLQRPRPRLCAAAFHCRGSD